MSPGLTALTRWLRHPHGPGRPPLPHQVQPLPQKAGLLSEGRPLPGPAAKVPPTPEPDYLERTSAALRPAPRSPSSRSQSSGTRLEEQREGRSHPPPRWLTPSRGPAGTASAPLGFEQVRSSWLEKNHQITPRESLRPLPCKSGKRTASRAEKEGHGDDWEQASSGNRNEEKKECGGKGRKEQKVTLCLTGTKASTSRQPVRGWHVAHGQSTSMSSGVNSQHRKKKSQLDEK